MENVKPDTKGKAGAILNIIFSAFFIFLSFLVMLTGEVDAIIFGLIFLALEIWTLVANIQFLKYFKNQVSAGVSGILFSGIIGGILVLVSQKA